MLGLRTDSHRATTRGLMTALALALCLTATAPAEPADPQTNDSATQYLARMLRNAASEPSARQLDELVRNGYVTIALPRSDLREIHATLTLLPDPAGPPVRLGRVDSDPAVTSGAVRLKLARSAKRRLRKLWVAALELDATLAIPGGATVHARHVFLSRR